MGLNASVPLRTPLTDASGNPTRAWFLFFNALQSNQLGPPINLVVVNGSATPDLSQGNLFVLLLTADTILNLPTNAPGVNFPAIAWQLVLQQDGTGGHSINTTGYPMTYTLSSPQSPANTECVIQFSTDSTGTRVTAAPTVDQPIP